MASGEGNASVLAWAAATLANHIKNVPAAIKQDLTQGSGPSILREMVNDVRGTGHQVFFGQAEMPGQQGTPMQPLPSDLAAQRQGVHGRQAKGGGVHGAEKPDLRKSPSEIAAASRLNRPPTQGNGHDNGHSR